MSLTVHGASAISRKPRENRTRWVVLGMLTTGELTGYGLRQRIAGSVGHFWQESYGQLYPTLRQLVREKLVSARAAAGDRPGRHATTYRLTARGRAALSAWVALPPVTEPERNEVLLKVFFAGSVPPETTIRNLEGVAASIQAWRTELEGIAAAMSSTPQGHPDAPYWRLTLDFGLDVTRTMLDWLAHAKDVLRGQARRRQAPATRAGASRTPRRSA